MAVLDARHEEAALGQLRERLAGRFAERSGADIKDIVDRATARFANARIRQYIPLIVERIARDELDHRLARG